MISQSEMPLAILGGTRFVPLVSVERLDHAVPLAQALVGAGMTHLEIALRTPVAPQAIKEIARALPKITLIAGNVLTPHDLAIAAQSGAHMATSPIATPALLEAAAHGTLPFIPGIASPSELMLAITKGFHVVKFFPAISLGPEALRAMQAPFPHARFIPTGGTSERDLDQWLALPQVCAVGGAWLAPPQEIRDGNWPMIRDRAQRVLKRLRDLGP